MSYPYSCFRYEFALTDLLGFSAASTSPSIVGR